MRLTVYRAPWILPGLVILAYLLPTCHLRTISTPSLSEPKSLPRRRLAKSSVTCEPNDSRCFKVKLQRAMRLTERRILGRLEHRLHLFNQTLTLNQLGQLGKLWQHVGRELDEVNEERFDLEATMNLQLQHQQERVEHLEDEVQQLNQTLQLLLLRTGQVLGNQTAPLTSPDGGTSHIPKDCQEAYDSGRMPRDDGRHSVIIQPHLTPDAFRASCRLINTTAWTVIQRRQDGSVDFFRTWSEYREGFGSTGGEMWAGNEHIYQLTNQGDYRLRIEMENWEGDLFWAEYNHFKITDEDDKYRLHVSGYRGNAGDSLTSYWSSHDGAAFSTWDADNDNRNYDNCADDNHGAWWFTSCFESNLNGKYYHEGEHNDFFVRNGIQWNAIHLHSSLRRVEMMVVRLDENILYEMANDLEED